MKLKSVDQPNVFYQVAHHLIILQQDDFSLEDIFKQYQKKCGSNINFEYVKKYVIETLEELLERGIVKKNRDGSETYYTIFIEDKTNQDKLKSELAKDEGYISLY